MRHLLRALVVALTALASVAPAFAAGAWTVYVRPTGYRDVIAQRETVWVSTADAGLLRYLRSSATFEAVLRTPGGLASNALSVIAKDRSGRLWVGTNGSGASRLSADGSSWSLVNAFDGLPSDSITSLTAEGDTMWIGTAKGLALWDGRQVSGALPDGVNPSPFANNFISGIVVDGDTVLVGTPEGIYFARKSDRLRTWTAVNTGLISTNCTGLVADRRDVFALANGGTHLWQRSTAQWGLASGNGSVRRMRSAFGRIVSISTLGMYTWTGSAWTPVTGSPPSGSSGDGGVAITLDPDGLGVAAPTAGLEIAPAWTAQSPPGPIDNNVSAAISSRGSLYVGTQEDGVSRLRNGVWTHFQTVCDPCTTSQDPAFKLSYFCYGMHVDPRGVKWFGMWSGSIGRLHDLGVADTMDNRLIKDGQYTSERHTFGWAAASDRFGRTWIGLDTPDRGGLPPIGFDVYDSTGAWLRSFQPLGSPFPQAGLNNGQIRALEVDRRDQLWIGYAGGGIDRAQLSPTNPPVLGLFDIGSEVGTMDVFGIRASGDSLWILTTDALRRITIGGTTVGRGSASLALAGAMAPRGAVHPLEIGGDGSVWVGSTAGVRHYKLKGGYEDFTIANSPLPSNEVRSVFRDPVTGVLWFATSAGIAGYDPGYQPPSPPKLTHLVVKLWPNPVQTTGIGFVLRVDGAATQYEGSVYDVTGRRVRRFDRIANRGTLWDGRNDDGELVRPGLYFVRIRGGGAEATARIAVVR